MPGRRGPLLGPSSGLHPGASTSVATPIVLQEHLVLGLADPGARQGNASCPGRSVPPLGFHQHLPGLGRCPALSGSGEEPPGPAGACSPSARTQHTPAVPLSCPKSRDEGPEAGADPKHKSDLCWEGTTLRPKAIVSTVRLGSHSAPRAVTFVN